MKGRKTLALGLALGLAVTGFERVWAQSQPAKNKDATKTESGLPRCPVMADETINFAISLSTNEGPVFFCCKDCIPKYQANPTKYAEKVAAQRKALSERPRVQTTCPVTGEAVKEEFSTESGGKKVLFCCKGCISKFQKDPDKYKANLANSYTYQTKCPVSGEEVDSQTVTTAANGQKVYFCCKSCEKKFVAEPTKYAPQLEAQGYVLDKLEMKKGPDDK